MSLTVRHARGDDALERWGVAFDQLCREIGCPVTSRRPWLQAWVDCHDEWTPWLVLVEDGGRLVAAAPLARRVFGGLLRVVGLGHGPTDDFRLPATDPAAAVALASAVVDGLPRRRPWLLQLDQMPDPDDVLDALLDVLPQSARRSASAQPLVRVVDRDLNRYLSKNTRKSLAKIRNRLEADGLVPDFAWTTDAAAVRSLIPAMSEVHRARDEQMGRRSDHDDPRAARFFAEVISAHAERGEVDVLTLRLRGELAAYVCGFADGSVLRSWDNRLSPAWSAYSAGRIANTEALTHVVTSERYDALDWMRGEEPYKLQSATAVVPMQALEAASSAVLLRAAGLPDQLRARKRQSRWLTTSWEAAGTIRRRVVRRGP